MKLAIFLFGMAAGMLYYRILVILMLDSYSPTMCDYCKLQSERKARRKNRRAK